MKKLIAFVLELVCVLGLVGCTTKNEIDTGALSPMLTINGENYFASTMPIAELPDDYECLGEITAEETNDTGLQGCKYYANKYISSFDEFYLYQECGTPIDENTVDPSQRQWAYVKWVREGFDRTVNETIEETDTESSEEVVVGGDLIPMVMVNGELYMDTGHESTVEVRCGMMDGEITSTVDGTEQPTKDNESNFGTGYGYQYGSHEGLIEIYMNDKWWVFATEKVLASSELMIDPVAPVSIRNIFTGESANITENEDIRTISNILFVDSWNSEAATDCLSNIEITINGTTYIYHSDCGTFNDNINQRYLSLDDETANVVDTLFAKYISLTSTEVPSE